MKNFGLCIELEKNEPLVVSGFLLLMLTARVLMNNRSIVLVATPLIVTIAQWTDARSRISLQILCSGRFEWHLQCGYWKSSLLEFRAYIRYSRFAHGSHCASLQYQA